MKRLILIQNDYPGAGKSTLCQCLDSYLQTFRAPHHRIAIVENADPAQECAQLEIANLRRSEFIAELDRSDLIIMEVETGLSEVFGAFYKRNDLDIVLPELGVEMLVAVPVTSDRESFDGVTSAAEAFSDTTQYLVVHTPTSSFYDEDENCWERSRASRVMDMFEATDLEMPACQEALEFRLKQSHTDLQTLLRHPADDPVTQEEMVKWSRRAFAQIDSAGKYIFGDAFHPTIMVKHTPATKQRRTRKPKTTTAEAAA